MERMPLVQNIFIASRESFTRAIVYSQKTSFSFSFLFPFLFSWRRWQKNIEHPSSSCEYRGAALIGNYLEGVGQSFFIAHRLSIFSATRRTSTSYGSYETREPKIVWKKWLKDIIKGWFWEKKLIRVEESKTVYNKLISFHKLLFVFLWKVSIIWVKKFDNLSKEIYLINYQQTVFLSPNPNLQFQIN